MAKPDKNSRRDQILHMLAQMLEEHPGGRITTATLARQVGVSEAALYRHFPSKARMFEGLIAFIENTLFSRISRIIADNGSVLGQWSASFFDTDFAEKNPG